MPSLHSMSPSIHSAFVFLLTAFVHIRQPPPVWASQV
jgi:hypothetical protein